MKSLAPVKTTGSSLVRVKNAGQAGSHEGSETRVLVVGGLAGALLASSCCVLPLVLVTLGVTGTWMSDLTALAPFKPYFLTATAALLGLGFWQVYRRKPANCLPGTLCAVPAARRVTKTLLWFGAGLALIAASIDLWAPYFW
jgi:mercuric ion transport protein